MESSSPFPVSSVLCMSAGAGLSKWVLSANNISMFAQLKGLSLGSAHICLTEMADDLMKGVGRSYSFFKHSSKRSFR